MTEIFVNTPEEIIERLRNLAESYPDEATQALWDWAAKVLNDKSARLCPFRTGYLRGSRFVSDPSVAYGEIALMIGYAAEYAWYVHENLLASHKPPTQAKFLEVPLMEAMPGFAEEITRRILRLVEEGGV